MQRQRSTIPHQSNSKFSSTQHARFHQLTRIVSAFNRFESHYIIQFGISCKNLSIKEGMSRLRTSKISMLSQTHGMTSTSDNQNQKSHIAVKENREPIQHIFCWSADWWFGLLWCFGVACIQAATQMMSCLQKLLYGVWRYFVRLTANTEVFWAKISTHIWRCLFVTYMLLH